MIFFLSDGCGARMKGLESQSKIFGSFFLLVYAPQREKVLLVCLAMNENEIGTRVIGCAIEVHRQLGPGLLESVYQKALAIELADADLRVQREVPVLIKYKGYQLDEGFRADL